MESKRTVRGYLTCENHGDTGAEHVCGECGTPVCTDCGRQMKDVTLGDYATDGANRFLIGAFFVALSVFLVDQMPRAVWGVITGLAGKPLYLPLGLKPAFLLTGLALLATLRFRTIDRGFDVSEFQALTRQSNERVVCESCYEQSKRLQLLLFRLFGVIAVVLAFYGLYQSVTSLFFEWLWISGVGVAVWILRSEFVIAILTLLE